MKTQTKKKGHSPVPGPEAPPPAESGPQSQAALSLPRFSARSRLLLYPLCVLFPGGGLVLAAFYAAQKDKEARFFGRICLALSLVGAMAQIWRAGAFHGIQSSDALTQPYY
jgi:hypothetical protein